MVRSVFDDVYKSLIKALLQMRLIRARSGKECI